jgi:hypothetical protein
MEVDHINHNGLDNRRINLRIATARQNKQNTKIQKSNTSGYKGVTKDRTKWRAMIRISGKRVHLGMFDDKRDAAIAYNRAAIKYHGDFACINDIPPYTGVSK